MSLASLLLKTQFSVARYWKKFGLLFQFGVPIASIIVVNTAEYPYVCDEQIGEYLMTSSILTLCLLIVPYALLFSNAGARAAYKNSGIRNALIIVALQKGKMLQAINSLLSAAMFGVFIWGNVVVFGATREYCDRQVYDYGFWLTITQYILLGLACLIVCPATIIASKNPELAMAAAMDAAGGSGAAAPNLNAEQAFDQLAAQMQAAMEAMQAEEGGAGGGNNLERVRRASAGVPAATPPIKAAVVDETTGADATTAEASTTEGNAEGAPAPAVAAADETRDAEAAAPAPAEE